METANLKDFFIINLLVEVLFLTPPNMSAGIVFMS